MQLREGEPRPVLEPELAKNPEDESALGVPRHIQCRHCHESIAQRDSGAARHVFANPAGRVFEILIVRRARLVPFGAPTEEHTWFPGFAWRAGSCPGCAFHLGWIFDAVEEGESFCGLITSEVEES